AVSTLRSAPVPISFLNGGEAAVLAHALDGCDLLALATCCQQRARQHGRAVNQHRASTAGRVIAAALRAGKLQVLSQGVKQELARLDTSLVTAAVYFEFDQFLFHFQQSATTRLNTVAPSDPPSWPSRQFRRAWTGLFRILAAGANSLPSANARRGGTSPRCDLRDRVPDGRAPEYRPSKSACFPPGSPLPTRPAREHPEG